MKFAWLRAARKMLQQINISLTAKLSALTTTTNDTNRNDAQCVEKWNWEWILCNWNVESICKHKNMRCILWLHSFFFSRVSSLALWQNNSKALFSKYSSAIFLTIYFFRHNSHGWFGSERFQLFRCRWQFKASHTFWTKHISIKMPFLFRIFYVWLKLSFEFGLKLQLILLNLKFQS